MSIYFSAFSVHFSLQSGVCHITVLANAKDDVCLRLKRGSTSNRMLTADQLTTTCVINNNGFLKVTQIIFNKMLPKRKAQANEEKYNIEKKDLYVFFKWPPYIRRVFFHMPPVIMMMIIIQKSCFCANVNIWYNADHNTRPCWCGATFFIH